MSYFDKLGDSIFLFLFFSLKDKIQDVLVQLTNIIKDEGIVLLL